MMPDCAVAHHFMNRPGSAGATYIVRNVETALGLANYTLPLYRCLTKSGRYRGDPIRAPSESADISGWCRKPGWWRHAMGLSSTQALAQPAPQVPADPTKVQGRPPSALGDRSPFEAAAAHPQRDVVADAARSAERHHHARRISTTSGTTAACRSSIPSRYTLTIHGMVDRPTVSRWRT